MTDTKTQDSLEGIFLQTPDDIEAADIWLHKQKSAFLESRGWTRRSSMGVVWTKDGHEYTMREVLSIELSILKPPPEPATEIRCPRCNGGRFSVVEDDSIVRAAEVKDGVIHVDCTQHSYEGDTHTTRLVCESGCGLEFPVPLGMDLEWQQ